MAQRGGEESQLPPDWGGKGNIGVKAGRWLCVFRKSLTPEAVSGIFCMTVWYLEALAGIAARSRS
jgi:hypothetical protein